MEREGGGGERGRDREKEKEREGEREREYVTSVSGTARRENVQSKSELSRSSEV